MLQVRVKRLGGAGEPLIYERTSRDDPYTFGIPRTWHFTDEADLPRFESEAAYLRRLNLLSPHEKNHIRRSDYLPVLVRGAHDDPRTFWRAAVIA